MHIIGQRDILEDMEIHIKNTIEHKMPLPNTLITGPSGHGKTTFAIYLADRIGILNAKRSPKFIRMTGAELKTKNDIEDMAFTIGPNDLLFIDEVHDLAKRDGIREMFFEMMDFNTLFGNKIPKFTVVASTNELSAIPHELLNRFMLKYTIKEYTREEIAEILIRNLDCPEDVAIEIAKRSRLIPREAKWLFKRTRAESINFAVTMDNLKTVLTRAHIDDLGLNDIDRRILSTLYKRQAFLRRNAIGLSNLCDMLGIKEADMRLLYEPYLVKIGFVDRHARGRVLTMNGKEYVESIEENNEK